jgi:hypothetical protein
LARYRYGQIKHAIKAPTKTDQHCYQRTSAAVCDRSPNRAWPLQTALCRPGSDLRDEPAWRKPDAELHAGLAALPERSVAALEGTTIWPRGTLFHREPMPPRIERGAWGARKRAALDGANIVFLDPDNGLGEETEKHTTFAEVQLLRKPNRAIVFITFPGRSMPHDALLRQLNERLIIETDAESVLTLRTNVSVPRAEGSGNYVQRWLTPRLLKMGLEEGGMGWHSFKRFRKTWLRGVRCLEDLNNFWMAHKPQTVSELYSHLHEELELRLKEAERVGYGFDLPEAVVAPNAPKISTTKSAIEVAA